ncbi:MAG: hypothetical protein JW932_14645 [Deltaproteobacteria bacterium]|nr:hypothetical protein [Deltaproteobacteria bacterium]
MLSVLETIENIDLDLDQTDYYAAILGESPSKGAKSPSLWNGAFDALGLSAMMHPMDIVPEKLMAVVECLRKDKRFIGGAVTMPYKINILPFLDKLEPEAEMIGAVNCIYRDGEKLIGSNTDGAGAIWSLEKEIYGGLNEKTVLQIGTGGAGFAVASYLSSAIGPRGCLKLANRSHQSRKNLAAKLYGRCRIEQVEWPLSSDDVRDLDILVNCTSIGFKTLREDSNGIFSLNFYTPLGPVDDSARVKKIKDAEKIYLKSASDAIKANIGYSFEILASMDNPFIFDIIYQPPQSMLLCMAELIGYKTLNGAPMNLEQAVIAFKKAVSASGLYDIENNEVRDIMRKIW